MDRRLVIAISFLIVALAALAAAGLFSPAGAPAAGGGRICRSRRRAR